MKFGFVKVRAVTPSMKLGAPAYNGEKIEREITKAEDAGVELLVFPELCLTGYTCGDLFLQKQLLEGAKAELCRLISVSEGKKVLFFVGLPLAVGANVYNCAVAVQNGTLLAVIPKLNIPNFGEFCEYRYFTAGERAVKEIELFGKKVPFGANIVLKNSLNEAFTVACEICQDLWVANPPCASHASAGAKIIVNLSASTELVGKMERRKMLLRSQSARLNCGYVYANAGKDESTSDLIFAGHNLVAENGSILHEALPFSGGYAESEIDLEEIEHERRRENTFVTNTEGYTFVSFAQEEGEGELTRKVNATPFVPQGKELERRCGLILSMQSSALAKRLEHTRSKTAVIGISGGLDSSLAVLVTVRAFDLLGKKREDIIAVTMPGFGTTVKTKNNSISLMQSLGVTMKTVNIGGAVNRHFKDIEHDAEDKNVTYENAQARYRTMVLMDIANDNNGLVIGTGDLSELALGWCTYNGDHMSNYSVNGSIPKTLVKSLVAYEGKRVGGRLEIVLNSILNTEISPELLPPDEKGEIAQKTEDIVGPYELHDFYLYQFVRRGFSPEKTLYLAEKAFAEKYDRATLKKWLINFYRRFFAQQFKRNCAPDGVKVGTVSLSPRGAWLMPSDASASLWLERAEKL